MTEKQVVRAHENKKEAEAGEMPVSASFFCY